MKYPDDFINKIICGDCLETIVRFIPDKVIDLTITSPPYNLGNNHHTGNYKHQSYDDNLPEQVYQQWQIDVLDEIYRITKDSGSLFYNHKNRIKKGVSISPYQWLLKTNWIIKQELVWFNGSQNFDRIRFYPMTERVYWLVKSPETKLNNLINHHDLFQWKAVGTKKEHKRAFPEDMIIDILSCFPNAKIIFDPFSGSGTTAIISKKMGKNYIGIDVSDKYCEIARKRVNATPEPLFV